MSGMSKVSVAVFFCVCVCAPITQCNRTQPGKAKIIVKLTIYCSCTHNMVQRYGEDFKNKNLSAPPLLCNIVS